MSKKLSVIKYDPCLDLYDETMNAEDENNKKGIDSDGVEEYIIDMARELHSLAEKSQLQFIALLLKLVCDAIQSSKKIGKP